MFRTIRRFLASRKGAENTALQGLDTARLPVILGTRRPTILEIGSHDGTHTRRFLRVFDRPRIECFEPEPRAIERFVRTVGAAPGVRLWEVAVGARSGTTTFHRSGGPHPGPDGHPLPGGWDYSGSIRRPLHHRRRFPLVDFPESIEVPLVAIDDWIEGRGIDTIDLVWMDVQGAEGDVLAGMRRTLPRVRFIYTETSDDELYEGQPTLSQVLATLPGFSVIERFPEDVLLGRA